MFFLGSFLVLPEKELTKPALPARLATAAAAAAVETAEAAADDDDDAAIADAAADKDLDLLPPPVSLWCRLTRLGWG